MSEADQSSETVQGEVERRVSWAELFFDLVFVVAVTRISGLLREPQGWAELIRALVVFVPIYWLWVGTSVLTNFSDVSRPLVRMRIFAIALAGIFMALSLPHAYGRLGYLGSHPTPAQVSGPLYDQGKIIGRLDGPMVEVVRPGFGYWDSVVRGRLPARTVARPGRWGNVPFPTLPPEALRLPARRGRGTRPT